MLSWHPVGRQWRCRRRAATLLVSWSFLLVVLGCWKKRNTETWSGLWLDCQVFSAFQNHLDWTSWQDQWPLARNVLSEHFSSTSQFYGAEFAQCTPHHRYLPEAYFLLQTNHCTFVSDKRLWTHKHTTQWARILTPGWGGRRRGKKGFQFETIRAHWEIRATSVPRTSNVYYHFTPYVKLNVIFNIPELSFPVPCNQIRVRCMMPSVIFYKKSRCKKSSPVAILFHFDTFAECWWWAAASVDCLLQKLLRCNALSC